MNSRSSKQVQSTTIKQMDPKQLNAIQIIIIDQELGVRS